MIFTKFLFRFLPYLLLTTASTPSLSQTNTAPNAVIGYPFSGATYTAPASIPISMLASDAEGPVSKVELYIGGSLAGTFASGGTLTWNNVAAGTYVLTIKVYDSGNLVTTSNAVTVSVLAPDSGNAAPSASVVYPVNAALYMAPASFTVIPVVADSNGSINRVEYFFGTTMVAAQSVAPFGVNVSNLAAGTYPVTVKVWDNQGASTQSAAVSVTVTPTDAANAKPTVSLSAPAANSVYALGAAIPIAATAADADGSISRIEFVDSGIYLGTMTAAPYTGTLTINVGGTHALTARAFDNKGAMTVSTTVPVIVSARPTASISAPAANAVFVAPANVAINATAADGDGSVSRVEFYSGTTLLGTSTTAPHSHSWNGVAAGAYSLTVKAFDNVGLSVTSAAVPITVTVLANQLPTVSLTAPAEGAVVSAPGSVTLSAAAADADGTVTKVEFYNGSTLLGTATASPYTYQWSAIAAGSYSLTAKVFDNSGASVTSAPVTLISNAAPTIAWMGPPNNTVQPAPATFTLTASASDSDGTITKVEFYRGGTTLIGTATTSPYSYSWTNVAAGSYSVTARSYDNRGRTATSTPVTLVSNGLPSVSLTAPANNTVTSAPATFVLTASATDADGSISKVEFYNGSTLIGTATTAPYSYSWSGVPSGSYSVTARAYDNRGATANSSVLTLVSNTAPTVSITAPANNSVVTAPATYLLTATATDSDGSISKVEFYNGSTLIGTVTTAPYNYSWSGVAAGSYTITARAYDNRGTTTTSAALTLVSNTLPTVSISAPTNNSVVAPGSNVTLTASASDSDGMVSKVEFYNGATLLGFATATPYSYSWPAPASGTYSLTAKAYDNRNGTSTSAPISLRVNTLPAVSLTAPANNTVQVAPASFGLSATASDSDGSITKVEFYNGATLLGTATTAPYSFSWANVAAGSYPVSAKAYDNNGGVLTSPVVTLISNASPSVSITAPANNTVVPAPASFTLTAAASDSDGSVAKVEFYNATTLLGTVTAPPYTYNWTNVASGSHVVTAKAYDNRGTVSTSAAITLVSNLAPTVSITAPANNSVATAPATFVLNASAADSDGSVTKVEFYGGATLLATDTAAPFTHTWSNVPAGTHAVTVRAYDNRGVVTTSAPINLISNTLPTVSLTSPAAGANFAPPATISLAASAADGDGSISKVEFYNGSTLIGTATTAPYAFSWSGVSGGNYSLTAKAYDNRGAVVSSSAVPVSVSNNTSPVVSITSPASNEVFSEPGSFTVVAAATDGDGSIKKVEFYRGGTLIATSTAAPFSVEVEALEAGAYSFTAKAYDNAGSSSTSVAVSVIVNRAPSVSITSPADFSSLPAGSAVTVNASALDTDGTVSQVEFYRDGVLVSTDTSSPFSARLTGLAKGAYTFSARAIDNRGAMTESASVTVTIGSSAAGAVTYTYDGMGRLIEAKKP